MSAWTYIELTCDFGPDGHDGGRAGEPGMTEAYGVRTVTEARHMAARDGWSVARGVPDRDACPFHTQARKPKDPRP